jgi:predicted O-linked N-acetylglucosamine transferase (SPINDLY family)
MVDVNQLISNAQSAKNQGNETLALDYFQQALSLYPNEVGLLSACGNLCVKLTRFEEAASYFRRILHFNKSPEVINALCYALQALGNQAQLKAQYQIAAACFEEALQHQPSNPAYWYNLGNAQRELQHFSVAATSFQQAILGDPTFADAYNNLGNIQRELGQLDLAIESYQKALSINPNLFHALSHLVHQKQHICDWHGQGNNSLMAQIERIRHWIKTKPEAQISPFAFLAMPSTTAAEQKLCASNYVEQNYRALFELGKKQAYQHKKQAKPKINVGYLSADFRLHPLAFLITELIENHDRSRFNILAYSYGKEDETPVRKRLIEAFDSFVDIRAMNDLEAATKINADQIDILVDLTGFTQSSRTGIVALKPASIHINWLGYPGTMGAFNQDDNNALFDYIIVDKTIAPDQKNFSEKLLYLPCYQPNTKRAFSTTTNKAAHHLPENSFVFCCFNQTFKITADVFAVWMRLLKKVPDSVLWLLDCNQCAKENLRKEAVSAGIDQNRLIFAARTHSDAHLERQRHADLFLDTTPYNAHTTASDVIWVGIPIVTWIADTFPARVAASLLKYIGLSELICESLPAYEKKALAIANNRSKLNELKTKINIAKTQSNLFNAQQFAQQLEAQYQSVWQAYCQDTSLTQ